MRHDLGLLAKSLGPPGGALLGGAGALLEVLEGTGISSCKSSRLEEGAQGSFLARAPGWREEHMDHFLQGPLAGGRSTGIILCEGSCESMKVAGRSSSLRSAPPAVRALVLCNTIL